jgi:hypothetical protein
MRHVSRDAITLPSLILSITVRLFFGGDTAGPSVGRRLDAISRQIEQLGHDLRIVSETVALQARFQLAVTPSLSAAAQHAACTLASERSTNLPRKWRDTFIRERRF